MSNLAIINQKANEISLSAQNLVEQMNEYSAKVALEQCNNGIDPTIFAYTLFILALFIGYYAVWKVTPALHTPLMSVTNAISGVIIISAMLSASYDSWNVASILGLVATFLAAVNVFGGFIVTKRMLDMFKR